VLSGFKDGPHEPLIADSIDFVVARMDQKLSRAELASRLALNTQLAAASPVQLPDSAITIMDCNDFASVPGNSFLFLPPWQEPEQFPWGSLLKRLVLSGFRGRGWRWGPHSSHSIAR